MSDEQQAPELKPCPFCPAALRPFPAEHLPADLQDVAGEWFQITHNARCFIGLLGFGDYPIHQERLAAWNTRADLVPVAQPPELDPHKAINFLTVLEHQAHRNHEYHPANCGECAMTEQIANKLREQLGLEIRAAK